MTNEKKEKNKERSKKYYEDHKEEVLKKAKEYREKNKDRVNKKIKEWREKNKEYKKQKDKEYAEENIDKIKAKKKKWYEKNKEQVKERVRNNRIKNPRKEAKKEYYEKNKKALFEKIKERRKNDISKRILSNLRSRLSSIVKSKCGSTMELTGCSIQDLIKHLETNFKENMSWDNYGLYGWHIDHILPCAYFNLSLEEDQKKCFHYTNLQPLWAEENLKKGSKI